MPQAKKEIVERTECRRILGKKRGLSRREQRREKPLVFGTIERDVRARQPLALTSVLLPRDQIVDERQACRLVQPHEVCFHLAGAKQMDPGEQNAKDVEQRL